jgi:hypothetical protein
MHYLSRSFKKPGLSLVFACLSFFGEHSYTLVVQLSDLQTMAKRSDLVVHGYVGNQRVEKDSLGRPITLSEVEVVDGLYGAKSGEIITIYQVGGEKDGVHMPILGGHVYKVFQELIFFGLKVDNAYVSYGAGQGKLDIISVHKNENVREDLGNIIAVDPYGRANSRGFVPLPLTFPEKDTLKNEIRLMLKDRKPMKEGR